MANFELLVVFMTTTVLFAFLPGPAMLYAAAHVMSGGRQAGIKAVLGIHIGGYAHIIATAAGLAILLQVVPLLYSVLKIAGAAYLIWLGICMVMRHSSKPTDANDTSSVVKAGDAKLSQSILVELLNPKTALFFLAYLPQFVDPAGALPMWLQLFILGFLVNFIFTIADLTVVLGAASITQRLKGKASVQRLIQRIGGTVLIGLGADLMLRKQ